MPINHVPIETNDVRNIEKKNAKGTSFIISDPKYTFSDVILPKQTQKEIGRFLTLIEKQEQIFTEWGLGTVIKHHNL